MVWELSLFRDYIRCDDYIILLLLAQRNDIKLSHGIVAKGQPGRAKYIKLRQAMFSKINKIVK